MGNKMKLRLKDLEVSSFVTSSEQQGTKKGGSIWCGPTFRPTECAPVCTAVTLIASCYGHCESGGHNPQYCTVGCTDADTCNPCSAAFTNCPNNGCGANTIGQCGGGGMSCEDC